jgi:hypothetical protein
MAIGVAIAGSGGGHPVWHLVLPAVASGGVFAGLKMWECWPNRTAPARRTARIVGTPPYATPVNKSVAPRNQGSAERWTRPSAPTATLAAASAAASAIHVAVCPAHFHEATAFGLFFILAATLQAAWAVLILRQPSRALLTLGAVGNLAAVAVWAMSRTVGVPIGPTAWRPEAVTATDSLATALELAIIAGVPWFLFRRQLAAYHAQPASS